MQRSEPASQNRGYPTLIAIILLNEQKIVLKKPDFLPFQTHCPPLKLEVYTAHLYAPTNNQLTIFIK